MKRKHQRLLLVALGGLAVISHMLGVFASTRASCVRGNDRADYRAVISFFNNTAHIIANTGDSQVAAHE